MSKHFQLSRHGVLNFRHPSRTKDAEQDAGAEAHVGRPKSGCRTRRRYTERGGVTEKEDRERETDSGNGAESAESTPCKHVGRKSPGQGRRELFPVSGAKGGSEKLK